MCFNRLHVAAQRKQSNYFSSFWVEIVSSAMPCLAKRKRTDYSRSVRQLARCSRARACLVRSDWLRLIDTRTALLHHSVWAKKVFLSLHGAETGISARLNIFSFLLNREKLSVRQFSVPFQLTQYSLGDTGTLGAINKTEEPCSTSTQSMVLNDDLSAF